MPATVTAARKASLVAEALAAGRDAVTPMASMDSTRRVPRDPANG